MKLRAIKRQGGRRPAIPEHERRLTLLPPGPAQQGIRGLIEAIKHEAQRDGQCILIPEAAQQLSDQDFIAFVESVKAALKVLEEN